MGGYDIKQVCLNGHVTNDSFGKFPEGNKDFCDKCGQKTITGCPECGNELRGAYQSKAFSGSSRSAQAFCEHCGKPFPWTEQLLAAAEELADEMQGLSKEEREVLKSSIHDIVQQNPHQSVAEIRIKKLAVKIGSEAAGFLRELLKGYVSKEVLKSLFG